MIYALIVLYNKDITDSITYNSIKEMNELTIIVYDNSKNEINRKFAKDNGIIYYSCGENIGLSKAYNFVIKKFKHNNNDYFIILDDDTEIVNEYYLELIKIIKQKKYDLILPIVYSDKKIISPSNIQFGCRVCAVKDISKIDMKKITAINSGMCVKSIVYDKVLYNENMFLDYVDHMFMKNIRGKNYSIYIMKSKLQQHFSRDEKQSNESIKTRFKIYKKDYKYYCSECKCKLFYYLSIFIFRLKMICKCIVNRK